MMTDQQRRAVNIEIAKGADIEFGFALENEDCSAIDLSGYDFEIYDLSPPEFAGRLQLTVAAPAKGIVDLFMPWDEAFGPGPLLTCAVRYGALGGARHCTPLIKVNII